MLDVFIKFLDIAQTLLGYSDELCEARQDRRNRMANLFDKISLCLSEVIESIQKEEIPYGKCAELSTYSNELPELIDSEIGEEKAQEIGRWLYQVRSVEALAQQSFNTDLTILKEAAGKFTALANILRI